MYNIRSFYKGRISDDTFEKICALGCSLEVLPT